MTAVPIDFHMPVFEATLFNERTEAIFRENFPKLTMRKDRPKRPQPDSLQVYIYLHEELGERCIPQKDIWPFSTLGPFDEIFDAPGMEAWRKITEAWCTDSLIEQSIIGMPMAWSDPVLKKRLAGKLIMLQWRPEFTIVSQEHIPTYLEDDEHDPLGPGHSLEARTSLASLILPVASNRHERLAHHAAFETKRACFDRIWKGLTQECETPLRALPDLTASAALWP